MSKGRQKDAGAEGPDQCTGKSGQHSINMKSSRREHGSNQLLLSCERKQKEIGPKRIVMWPERSSWKTQKRVFDIGWSDISQWQACQSEESTEKKAQVLPLSRMAPGQEGDSGGPQKVRCKRQEHRRKSGGGKEVSSRTLSVKANGTEVTSVRRSVRKA